MCSNSLDRIVTINVKYTHITPGRKTLHWLSIEHRSIFKTVVEVYKFLHSGHSKYFVPFLKPIHNVYNTYRSQVDCVLLEVQLFATLVYKSTKHFGLSSD